MSDRCGATAADYARQLVALLPPGPAWDGFRTLEGVGRRLLNALAREPARLHSRARTLLAEVRPPTVDEMLAAREIEAGLPDACTADALRAFEGRRAALVAKWRGRGGQSAQFYIDLLAAYGIAITVTEFEPFVADGSDAGDPLTNDNWTHVWQVTGPAFPVRDFQADGNSAEDPLRDWDTDIVRCLIERTKPAHTQVVYAFTE